MPAASLGFLAAGPPPLRAVFAADARFFIRTVPVPAEGTSAEVTSQVELALEGMSPFPLGSLYYGYFWAPGSGRALAFAAYRRRFPPEEVAGWAGAELVLPAFAALLGGSAGPATTLVLAAPEALTAIHWDEGQVPSQVLVRSLAPAATDEDRARARDELLRLLPSKTIIDLAGPPAAEASRSDGEAVFRCGDLVSRLPAAATAALDIRDKAELDQLRRKRSRGLLLWRVIGGCAAAAALMLLGELALFGGGFWQQARLVKLHAQSPEVERIMKAHALTSRIEDLSTKRLLPLEMIALVGAPSVRPDSIYFIRASTVDRLTLTIEAKTGNASEIQTYRDNLQALPACAKVDFKLQPAQNNITPFTIVVTFKPGALKPGAVSS